MTCKSTEFQNILQNELDLRKGNNPLYSMRSFASFLKIDSATLSRILNGKRAIGKNLIKKLSTKLNLSNDDLYYFLNKSVSKQIKVRNLALDSFLVISQFQHFALLEAILLSDYKGCNKWLAKKINISACDCEEAIKRLERIELIEFKNDLWVPTNHGMLSTYDKAMSTDAHRKLQITILNKAIQALENIPIKKRHQATLTFAVDSKKVPEIINKIDKFRKDLVGFISSDNTKKDVVYNFGQFLYPITNLSNSNKESQ